MNRIALLALFLVALGSACDDDRGGSGSPRPPGTTTCGNGRLEAGETCDSAVTDTSSAAYCPSACDDGIACSEDRLLGSAAACNAECSNTAVTQCANGDGCCPAGCTGANDDDCSSTCGNGAVDANETCDANCPATCDDDNRCTADTAYGSQGTCSYTCGYQILQACAGGDGCCPAGCGPSTDSDCSMTCGNGTIEANETCDGNCPTSCDDADACTIDRLAGNLANCSAKCSHQRITACQNGDGCCPSGCTSTTDSDCSAACGNNMVDAGETCDGNCPTTCDDEDACTTDSLTGSAQNCSAQCMHSAVSACAGGDGCCPAGCMAANDSDCTSAGGNVGDACTTLLDCVNLPTTPECRTDWPGGYCTMFCTSDPCPSGSWCDIELYICIDDCSASSCRSGYTCQQGLDTSESPYQGCWPSGP